MNTTLYLSFVVTSIIILAMPGPSFIYAIAVGARASAREISFNALGMGFGGLAIAAALAFGGSQLLAASPVAFTVLQVLGCIYLVYLGVATFFASPKSGTKNSTIPKNRSSLSSLLQGFVVETGNPKAILFYASLVPQFVDHALGDVQFQLLVLGVTFVSLQVAWDISLMLGVSRLRAGLGGFTSKRTQRTANRASGAVFVTLGVALLFQERPGT